MKKSEKIVRSKRPGSSENRRFLQVLVSKCPDGVIAVLGRLLGAVFYGLDVRHRRIVRRNLEFVYPGWSPSYLKGQSKKVFRNICVTILEILQMSCLSQKDIIGKVRIRGEGHFRKAMESSKGLILISAHLGNWEMAALFLSCYFQHPITSVARGLQPGQLDRWIIGLRTRFGNAILDKKGAMREMVRLLRTGGTLGILIDQGTRRSKGVEVSFFGKTVTATPAPALLQRRYGSLVFPIYCVRGQDGGLTVIVNPPLEFQKTSDSRADIVANTQIMTDAVEETIRAYPEQWLWPHKRWKRHYPHLYPEDMAAKKRKRAKKLARMGL